MGYQGPSALALYKKGEEYERQRRVIKRALDQIEQTKNGKKKARKNAQVSKGIKGTSKAPPSVVKPFDGQESNHEEETIWENGQEMMDCD